MIEFSDRDMAIRFIAVHNQLKKVIREFAAWSRREKMPSPVVTGLDRDREWYARNGLKEPRFSWHYAMPMTLKDSLTFVICAVDLRKKHYSTEQMQRVEEWFADRCSDSEWELVMVDHGTGPHIHIAYRDFLLRREWERLKENQQ